MAPKREGPGILIMGEIRVTWWWQLKYFNFHPENWGRWTLFDVHIFQRGWFNHQLEKVWPGPPKNRPKRPKLGRYMTGGLGVDDGIINTEKCHGKYWKTAHGVSPSPSDTSLWLLRWCSSARRERNPRTNTRRNPPAAVWWCAFMGLEDSRAPWFGGFLKWWYPTTVGFPTKNDHFGVFWGYHHLRKHPFVVKFYRI